MMQRRPRERGTAILPGAAFATSWHVVTELAETAIPADSHFRLGRPRLRRATKEGNMSILAWIILGLVSGFIASMIVNKNGEGIVLDIGLGIVGAVVGGFLCNMFGSYGVTGLNLWSILVAVLGAVVVLVIKHALTGRRTLRA
jgi:uncharacterized membrane protein YeaQ/YmgE (transglycosylase-associated protein family)